MNKHRALRVEKTPSQKTIQQSTPHLIPDNESTIEYQYSPPRVEENKIQVTTLLNHSTLLKNIRFQNTALHKYNLRNKNINPSPIQRAQAMFDHNHTINYIYNEDRIRETYRLSYHREE